MVWAQEMQNLVADIKTSHQDRRASLSRTKKQTRDILAEADDYMKKTATELKEMARDLKDFLAKSEENRKRDFNTMMEVIQDRIKEIKTKIRNFLTRSEEKRRTDFKAMINEIKEAVAALKRDVQKTLGDYRDERKQAAGYWASLSLKRKKLGVFEEEPEKPSVIPKAKKKKRKKEE